MGKLVGIFLIYAGGVKLAALLAVGFLLVFFLLKKHISRMDEGKWELYFRRQSNGKMLFFSFILYTVSLCLIGLCTFWLFGVLGYQHGKTLSCSFVLLGIFYVIVKYCRNKNSVLGKLDRLHQ